MNQEASRPVSRQISELSPIFARTKKIKLMGNSPKYSPPPTVAEKIYILILKLWESATELSSLKSFHCRCFKPHKLLGYVLLWYWELCENFDPTPFIWNFPLWNFLHAKIGFVMFLYESPPLTFDIGRAKNQTLIPRSLYRKCISVRWYDSDTRCPPTISAAF